MIIIKPTRWADVEPGSMILCTDAVLREIGKRENARGDGLTWRDLGITIGPKGNGRVQWRPDDKVLVIALDVDDPQPPRSLAEVAVLFMRAGFTVELLPL